MGLVGRRRRRSGGSDILTLIAALGGDTAVRAFYDARSNKVFTGSNVTTWNDARTTPSVGHGTPLLGVGTTKPVFNSTLNTITCDGIDNGLQTGTSSRFDLTLGRSIIYVGTLEASNGWPVGINDNPATKWFGIDCRTALEAKGNAVFTNTLPTTRGTTKRVALLSRSIVAPYGTGIPNLSQVVTKVWGRAGRGGDYLENNTAAVTASLWRLSVGNQVLVSNHAEVSAVIVLDHQATGSDWDLSCDWAELNHGAVQDTAATRIIYFDGDSLTVDPPTTVMADAAWNTNADYVGGAAPGVLSSKPPLWVYSRVGPAFRESAYTKKIYYCAVGTNDVTTGSVPAATIASNISLACQRAKAEGATLTIAATILKAGTFSGGQETTRVDTNNLILGGLSGVDVVSNRAAIAGLQDPFDGINYDVDTLHLTAAGYALVGNDLITTLVPYQ